METHHIGDDILVAIQIRRPKRVPAFEGLIQNMPAPKLIGFAIAGFQVNHELGPVHRLDGGDEPFAVLLGDTIIDSVIPVTRQLIDIYAQYKQSIVAVEVVPRENVSHFGIVSGEKKSDQILEVFDLIEKPPVKKSPSNLAIAGRYILTPEIFKVIDRTLRDSNNEIQLTDALKLLLTRESIYSYTIEGKRYDLGTKLDYLKTQVAFALKRKEFAGQFKEFLQKTIGNDLD